MAEKTTVKVGDKVTIITNTPEGHPVKGTVVVVQDEAGKQIGVELDEFTLYAHSLDGKTEEREQGDGLPVVGKGWWTTQDRIEKL